MEPPLLLVVEAEVVPNRLAVGMEEDEVVELVEIVGLLAIKENAGFGAADESVALCPKVKDGFAASAVDVSLLSAGLPKVNAGGGCSVGALGLQKEKPPVMADAGAASVSLLAPPKTKADGADGAAASFFSSGFPKVNVGAAGSLSACNDPNVEPPGGPAVAKVGAPNLPNTDPAVVVAVAELVFVDVVLLDDATMSLFSSEEAEGVNVTDEDEVVEVAVVVSDVFSSDFDSPKVKPPFEALLSVLDEPVPNIIPPPVPNLNPEPAAGWSDFLSSLEATPNLKPSDELPNLNPEEAVVSLEVVSDEELPKGTPNLNPPDGAEEDSVNEPPNLKPPDPNPEVLSDVPNLKPPELEVEEPNDDEPDVPPTEEPKALGSTLAPGLAA